MTTQEVIYLVGDFTPATLKRWEDWAAVTDRTIKRISFEEIPENNPIIILDEHGLNHCPLPE